MYALWNRDDIPKKLREKKIAIPVLHTSDMMRPGPPVGLLGALQSSSYIISPSYSVSITFVVTDGRNGLQNSPTGKLSVERVEEQRNREGKSCVIFVPKGSVASKVEKKLKNLQAINFFNHNS